MVPKWISNLWGGGKTSSKSGDGGVTDETLSAVVRGIQHAINSAIETQEQQFPRMIDRFFEKKTDDNDKEYLDPIVADVEVSPGHQLRVPLICLVNPTGLIMEAMRVRLSVRITKTKVKKATHDEDDKKCETTRTSFQVRPAKGEFGPHRRGDTIELEMDFKQGDTPEGVSRIIEAFANQIQPVPKEGLPGGDVEPLRIDEEEQRWSPEEDRPDDLDKRPRKGEGPDG